MPPSPPRPASSSSSAPSFRGASLYSGIFDSDTTPSAESQSTQPESTPSTAAATDSTNKTPAPSAAWSASLRFAPRRNVANKNKARPNAAFVTSQPVVVDDNVPASTEVLESTPAAASQPERKTEPIPQPAEAGPSSTEAMHALADQLKQFPILEAPPYTLPEETIQRDRQMARKAAEERGDIAPRDVDADLHSRQRDYDDQDADEDVNGFMATAAGKRAAAKKKKRRKRGNSPPPGPNLNADYDPRIPNDYLAFKQVVHERREAHVAHQRWLRESERDEYDDMPFGLEDRFSGVQTTATPVHSSPPRVSSDGRAVTGEEAYARRLAMSELQFPPTDAPPADLEVSVLQTDTDLAAKRSAAAAIAARLAKPLPSTAQSTETDNGADSAPFVERLMAKYGYVQGEGLGASGNKGMLEPLRAGMAKEQIVNVNADPKAAEETILYGSATASSVIVLLNMVTQADLYAHTATTGTNTDGHADQDIIQDIAEECAKFGIVSRIFAHISPSIDGGQGEVRVFAQFTGPAGGWKAVRALNGRWFEGRLVRALYYDTTAFERRDLDLPIPA